MTSDDEDAVVSSRILSQVLRMVYWLQLMSRVQDRVRGRVSLLLVLSLAFLLIICGWPVKCTAMPKDLLLINNGNSSNSNASIVKCKASLPLDDLHPDTITISDVAGSVGVSGESESDRTGGGHDHKDRVEVVQVNDVRVGILSRSERSVSSINSVPSPPSRLRHRGHNRTTKSSGSNLERNERSANLSHVNSKIQLFIKNRLLQILPDGTVNGTQDDASDYSE